MTSSTQPAVEPVVPWVAYYNAYRFLNIARNHATDPGTAADSSLIAVLFSAFAIEAGVNEMLDMVDRGVECRHGPELDALQATIELTRKADKGGRFSTDDKIRFLVRSTKQDPTTLGKYPFQDVALVFDARNYCVHHRGEKIELLDATGPVPVYSQHQLVGQVCKAAGIAPPAPGKGADSTLLQVLGRIEIGRWACKTATDALLRLARMLPASAGAPHILVRGYQHLRDEIRW